MKYATDVTAQKLRNTDFQGQIEAVSKSQAVIEFNMDGTILTANENFLTTMGYQLHEVAGKHHRMFAQPEHAASAEYREFWEKLRRGEFDSNEYQRIAKGGREVWIQASYNPILDLNGKPFKVVKYATDISAQKQLARAVEQVLGESQRVMTAVAQGDLRQVITGNHTGDLATLGDSINACIEKLKEVVVLDQGCRIRGLHRHPGDRLRYRLAEPSHRATSRKPRRNRIVDGGDDLDRQAKRRQCD